MKTLLVALLFISIAATAQKDTTHKDSIIAYEISAPLLSEIFNDIQMQASGKVDVKPEIWKELLQAIQQYSKPVYSGQKK